jgi:hypothetical protein
MPARQAYIFQKMEEIPFPRRLAGFPRGLMVAVGLILTEKSLDGFWP